MKPKRKPRTSKTLTHTFEEPGPTPEQEAEWAQQDRQTFARCFFGYWQRKAGERDNSLAEARAARQKKVAIRKQLFEALYHKDSKKGSDLSIVRRILEQKEWGSLWRSKKVKKPSEDYARRKLIPALRTR